MEKLTFGTPHVIVQEETGNVMVNRLSTLAGFLEDQSIPLWVKEALREKRQVILETLQNGQPYVLEGPAGEKITIPPELVAA